MTQQFDLALNMTKTSDKMMSGTSSSFMSKDSKTEMDSKFGNFLESANKNYTNKTSKSYTEEKRNNTVQKNTEHTNHEQSVKNSDTKTQNKETAYTDKKSTQTSETIKDKNNNISEKSNVLTEDNTADTKVGNETDKAQSLDDILQDAMIIANTSGNLQVQKVNTELQNNDKFMTTVSADAETDLPVDAIKNGISFDLNLSDVDTETLNEGDINAVNNLAKDVTAAKDNYISSMYKSANEKSTGKTVEKSSADLTEAVKSIGNQPDVKAENLQETAATVMPEQSEVLPQENISDNLNAETKSSDVEILKASTPNETSKAETAKNISAQVEDNVKSNETAVKNSEINSEKDVKTVDVEVVAKTADADVQDVEKSNIKSTENDDKIQDTKISDDKNEINNEKVSETVNNETLAQSSTEILPESAPTVATATEDLNAKNIQLQQEITSAKYENIANTELNKNQKEVSDKNAKTNVNTTDTKDIKEDVSGIEFVDAPKVDKTLEKTAQTSKTEISSDKTSVQSQNDVKDTTAEKIVKQSVDNVKIQVEENVKTESLNQNDMQAQKIASANETLEKAGLSTENLEKMDGKIKNVEYSDKNPKTDLGQSSQEMMMRDMMQNNASSAAPTDTVELKTDFAQNLNDKLQNTTLTQNAQAKDAPEVSIIDQIRAKFAVNNQNGMQKITIGLTPESLGKLNIEITKGQNGISAQILADNPQAKELLDKNLDGLKSALQSQGVNVNNVNVKVSEAGRSADSDNNNMFNREDGQFDSNERNDNSQNQDGTNKEKRSEYEFLQKETMKQDISGETEDITETTVQTEKTVSIKAGQRNVNYKL